MKQTLLMGLLGMTWVWACLLGGCGELDTNAKTAKLIAERTALAEKMTPSFVVVEYTLQHNNGQAPYGGGWRYRCPNCSNWHSSDVGEETIEEERPLTVAGILISDTEVLTADLMLNPRFIKKRVVRQGDTVVDVTDVARAKDYNAQRLTLSKPLPDAKPIVFDPKAKGPFFAVNYQQADTLWCISVGSTSLTQLVQDERGKTFLSGPSQAVIVNGKGQGLGVTMDERLDAEGQWKGSPTLWTWLDAKRIESLHQMAADRIRSSVLRVTLNFRSPRKDVRSRRYGDEEKTQQEQIGLVVSP